MRVEAYLEAARQFARSDHFRRLALLVAARTTPSEQLETVRHLFESLDEACAGSISSDQLAQALHLSGRCEVGALLSVFLSIRPVCLSVSVCLSVGLPICLSACPSI
jgi:hypothetical protein